MKFTSEYFDDVEDIIAARDDAESASSQRKGRRDLIRKFSNGISTIAEGDAAGTPLVNYLTTYKFLLHRKRRLEQSYTMTRQFVEIKVDTDNPEWDALTSLRMTTAFNRGCAHHRGGEFRNFVKSLAGEIQISGGAPVTFQKKGGWAPKLSLNMIFPAQCGLTAGEVPYSFAPEEFTLADLERLHDSVKGDGVSVDKAAVKSLIDYLKSKPKGETPTGEPSATEKEGTVIEGDDCSNRNAKINLWWYYEVKTKDDGAQTVSATMFNNEISTKQEGEESKVSAKIVAHFEKMFDSPEDWLQLVCLDMEIGGDTQLSSVRGLGEIVYPSSAEIELLLNLMLQGDKERARPKYQVSSSAVADEVLAWDVEKDSIVPGGVNPFDMKGSTSQLLTPMQFLMTNVANIGSGEVSNLRSGELRQQAVGRQQETASMQFGDMADWTIQLEGIALTSVKRAFTGDCKKGCRGYHQTMWVRSEMDRYKVPIKKLFQEEHGQLKFITVKVHKMLGDGGSDEENSAAEFLLAIRPQLPPQNRARVMQLAIAAKTKDPDLAEQLVQVPQPIINAQKLTAENECDTILRRALIGNAVTTNPDDVDMDHIPVHMLDMLALLSRHQLEPWKKIDVLKFAGLQRHTQDHFENALGDLTVRDEVLPLVQQFQQIVQAAQKLAADVEQREGQAADASQIPPLEMKKLELKSAELHLKAQKLGLEMEAAQSLEKQRLSRQHQTNRSGFVAEIAQAAQLSLDRRRQDALEAQHQFQKEQAMKEQQQPPPNAK